MLGTFPPDTGHDHCAVLIFDQCFSLPLTGPSDATEHSLDLLPSVDWLLFCFHALLHRALPQVSKLYKSSVLEPFSAATGISVPAERTPERLRQFLVLLSDNPLQAVSDHREPTTNCN